LPAQILVADDDPLTCELICEILRSAGMEANSVTDSAEAAERLRREKFHAVFLDMRMPPPNGVDLARQVRTSRVNASTVIVMITGDEDRTLISLELEAGRASVRLNGRTIRTIGTECMDIQFENPGANESRQLQEFLLPLILAPS